MITAGEILLNSLLFQVTNTLNKNSAFFLRACLETYKIELLSYEIEGDVITVETEEKYSYA
jgi:hypothetical protein